MSDPNNAPQIRVGLGHDTHRLAPGGPLILGGVELEFDFHLVGHSDADVLLHAVTDALLGASNQGDIGGLFPDTDPQYRGKDSSEMLTAAWKLVQSDGWSVGNLDCVILAERPKLLPHKAAICDRIAQILDIEAGQVSLKGKTGEKSGEVGEGKIIQAMCVCLLHR